MLVTRYSFATMFDTNYNPPGEDHTKLYKNLAMSITNFNYPREIKLIV